MTPEQKEKLIVKLGMAFMGQSLVTNVRIYEEFIFWAIMKKPEIVKEFFDVNEDIRKFLNIEGF